jgi:hypothetical protein
MAMAINLTIINHNKTTIMSTQTKKAAKTPRISETRADLLKKLNAKSANYSLKKELAGKAPTLSDYVNKCKAQQMDIGILIGELMGKLRVIVPMQYGQSVVTNSTPTNGVELVEDIRSKVIYITNISETNIEDLRTILSGLDELI